MVVEVSLVCVFGIALLALVLIFNSITVFNSPSYMAASPGSLYRDTPYVRKLPAFLERLREAGITSPWPVRPSPLRTHVFRRKLHRTFRRSASVTPALIGCHLSLWGFIQDHQAELDQAVFLLKHNRARRILTHSHAPHDRDCALAFLNSARPTSRKIRLLSPDPVDPGWLIPLKLLGAIFAEHGYELDPRLTALLHLESADDRSLLEELVQPAPPAAA